MWLDLSSTWEVELEVELEVDGPWQPAGTGGCLFLDLLHTPLATVPAQEFPCCLGLAPPLFQFCV